jgi:hypothetical protein
MTIRVLVRRTTATRSSGHRSVRTGFSGVGGGSWISGRVTTTASLSTNGDALPKASVARTLKRKMPAGLAGYVAADWDVPASHPTKELLLSATSTSKVAGSLALHSTGMPGTGALGVEGTAIVTVGG